MAGKSLEQRLATLREKQASIAEQIKKIETEKSQQLRKEKQERARIIGLAMLRRVEKEKCSEEELLALIDPFVISGKERRFLGLDTAMNDGANAQSHHQAVAKRLVRSQPKKSRQDDQHTQGAATAKDTSSEKASARSKRSTTERLPETVDNESLMAEFNL